MEKRSLKGYHYAWEDLLLCYGRFDADLSCRNCELNGNKCKTDYEIWRYILKNRLVKKLERIEPK